MIVALNCSREAWAHSTILLRFVSYAYMGGSVGTVLTYPFCGWLLSWAKWEVWTCLINHIFSPFYLFRYCLTILQFSHFWHHFQWVFYTTGGVTLLWSILWFSLVHDLPEDHPRFSMSFQLDLDVFVFKA